MTRLLKAGQVIGRRYKVIDFIGQGGMQEVYRAMDMSLLRNAALKVPMNKSGEKRFARSAAMSAKVTHPNVAKTYDYLEEDDRQYLVEELIAGNDLRDLLNTRFFRLDPDLTAHVLHHLAKGLAAVHREGVIHRDLKPGNIMLSKDHDLSDVKITDFGIAKMAEVEIHEGIRDETLASRTVVGAIPYMAPEVISDRHDVSSAADVWSVGALTFHLLTGEPPFGDGLQAVQKILAKRLPDKPAIVANSTPQFKQLVDELWALILQCLAADPGRRPSADDLVGKCNTLCYSRCLRGDGVIETYRPGSGKWGFIVPDGPERSVFFHADSYWADVVPEDGHRVCFSRFPGSPKDRAHPVLMIR